MRRVAIAAVIISMSFSAATAEDELRQISCDQENGFPSIALRKTSEMNTAGARTYIVDFQQDGPVIRLPPEYYSPDWKDVEEITFSTIDNARAKGRLTLKIRSGSGAVYVQPIGIIERACWNATKSYFLSSKINRPIKEIP